MALGFTIEKIAYRPLRNAPRLAPLITAIGVSIILQKLAMLAGAANTIPFRHPAGGRMKSWAPHITDLQIFIVVPRRAPDGRTLAVVERTRLGRAMRATSQSKEVAG
jgi:branched-chain amino acid transport system permease protein